LVAPTLPFGSSHHHLPFGGTLSLSTEVYHRTVYDLAESLITSGFRKVFILNGHGGNHEIIQLVTRDLALKYPAALAAGSYWDVAERELVAENARARGLLPGHAGAFETSMMLSLRPDLVRQPYPARANSPEEPAATYRCEIHGFWQETDGYTDSPAAASAANGEAYLAATVQAVAAAFVDFFHAADGRR
jgi:creatinine amidohydrolase